MKPRALVPRLALVALLLAPAAAAVQADDPGRSREQASLIEEQELLTRKLTRVVTSMQRLAERFDAEGRTQAAKLLRDGLSHIARRAEADDGLTLEERMSGSLERLGDGQIMQSIESQQRIIGELESLISILMDRPDLEQLEGELDRLTRQREELEGLAGAEEELREATRALREEAAGEAQRALEAGIEEALAAQRRLLRENEERARSSGALDLERLEAALDALLADQATDAGVLEDWDPEAAGALSEDLARLDAARREATRAARLEEAARELSEAATAGDAAAAARELADEAERAERAARASGDEAARRSAEALARAAARLREAGGDAERRAEAGEELRELAAELRAAAEAAREAAAEERAEAAASLAETGEATASGAVQEAARAAREALEEAAGAPESAEALTEAARRELARAVEESRFLGQAVGASQERNADRAGALAEGAARLPEEAGGGAAGEAAREALERAAGAMREAAREAAGGRPEGAASAADRGREALEEAREALAAGRAAQQANDPAAGARAAEQEALRQGAMELARSAGEASLGEAAREAVEEALEQAAEAMRQAAESLAEGRSGAAAGAQRQAAEALSRAGSEAREGVEPQTEEQRARAEELAAEQERIEQQLFDFMNRYREERGEESPELESLEAARQSAQEAQASLERGELERAREEEQETERAIEEALEDLAREEEQYQRLRQEELLFQIAEEVAAIREAHAAAVRDTEDLERERAGSDRASRGQKLQLRKIARVEEGLAARVAEIEAAIREEGSAVFSELTGRIRRDLETVAKRLGAEGGYRSGPRVQALQADVTRHLDWLAQALEEEQERREDEEQQQQQQQQQDDQQSENRLVPDTAELKLLARMETDVLDSIDELLRLYPELTEGGELDPLLLEEIQRLAVRHERSTELFRAFRARLGLEAPGADVDDAGSDGGGSDGEGGAPEGPAPDGPDGGFRVAPGRLLPVAAQDGEDPDFPTMEEIVGGGAGPEDPQARLKQLFRDVETKLADVDVLLSDAAAGDTSRLAEVEEAGIADLLRESLEHGRSAQRDIEAILEIARQMGQSQGASSSSSQGQQQGQSQGGEGSPLDRGQQSQSREATPEAPGGQRPGEQQPGQQQPGGQEPGGERPGEPQDRPGGEPRDPRAGEGDGENRDGDDPRAGAADPARTPGDADETWGNLPRHVQDAFRSEGRSELPARYRDWIDDYYRKLNRRSSRP
jgi:hypothetical protein